MSARDTLPMQSNALPRVKSYTLSGWAPEQCAKPKRLNNRLYLYITYKCILPGYMSHTLCIYMFYSYTYIYIYTYMQHDIYIYIHEYMLSKQAWLRNFLCKASYVYGIKVLFLFDFYLLSINTQQGFDVVHLQLHAILLRATYQELHLQND